MASSVPGSGAAVTPLEQSLLELLELPCITGEEGPIADLLAERLADQRVQRVGNSLVAGRLTDSRPLVLLVAHTDVVPPTPADREPRVEGDRIVGRGSSDMKAGLAVALDLCTDPGLRSGPVNTVLIAYAGEEGPHEGNELAGVLTAHPQLADADLAVILEPTDLETQLGCLGGLHATVRFTGRAAHSARPWHGSNALTAAGPLLSALHGRTPVTVPVDGLDFREVVSATQASTHNARNVIPDRFDINVNYRFSPARTLAEAERELAGIVGPGPDITVIDRSPPAPPRADAPMVRRFIDRVGAPVRPKQAWTDVARFAEIGVPALNFGPGLTAQAHQPGEYVPRENLDRARRALMAFLGA